MRLLLILLLLSCECEDQVFNDSLVKNINYEDARLDSLTKVLHSGVNDLDFASTGAEIRESAYRREFYKKHLEELRKNSKCL
jgi:hypothetical protein